MIMLSLLIGIAKANEYFNKPWLLAGIYAAAILLGKLTMNAPSASLISIFIPIALSFVLVAVILFLLYRFQDAIFTWLLILTAGFGLLVFVGGIFF